MSDLPATSIRFPKRALGVAVVLISLAGAAWWLWPSAESGQKPGAASERRAGPPGGGRPGFGDFSGPVPVRVATVGQGPFEVFDTALGTVTPLNTVNIRSRVAGELVEVRFEEGQKVKAGELLAVIDQRPYRVALAQAEAALAQNQALLKNARLDLARYQGLLEADSIARQTLDTQAALVEQYQAVVASNRAAVDQARLNLDYTEIRAPFDGRLGLRQLDVGNLVVANGDTPLVVITQTQPMAVTFTLPESELGAVLARHRGGESLLVQAWDRGERNLLGEGVLHSLDNQIDTATGTLKLKGRFDNADELLLPNQFVNVRLRVETLPQATLVPSAAVQYGTRGTFAYVLKEGNKVALRSLTLGPSNGATTVVLEGLTAGEQVVMEGTDRLRDDGEVIVAGQAEGKGPAAADKAPGQGAQ